MKTKAERLDEIIRECFSVYRSHDKHSENAKTKIIALFKECVPEEIKLEPKEPLWFEYQARGHFLCREETLKNIEEMGK